MFRVGQKVICIREPKAVHVVAWARRGGIYPHKNGIYTIRAINVWPEKTLLRFFELDNRHLEGVVSEIEPGFPADAFRPLVERKTDISIFTRMLSTEHADAS